MFEIFDYDYLQQNQKIIIINFLRLSLRMKIYRCKYYYNYTKEDIFHNISKLIWCKDNLNSV